MADFRTIVIQAKLGEYFILVPERSILPINEFYIPKFFFMLSIESNECFCSRPVYAYAFPGRINGAAAVISITPDVRCFHRKNWEICPTL